MWLTTLPLALLIAYIAYNRLLHPLAGVPGPFLASITPLWLAWQGYRQRRPALDLALHRRYGRVVRISPHEVLFADADHFRTVYGAGTTFTKARFYEATRDDAQPNRGHERLDMLTEADVDKLRVQKRLVGPVYALPNLRRHEPYVDNNVRRWISRLGGLLHRPLDVYHEIELLAVDTMCEVTFGQPFGAVDAGSDGGHTESFNRMWAWWGWTGYLPWFNAFDKKWLTPSTIFLGAIPSMPVFPFCVGKMTEYQTAVEAGEPVSSGIHDDLRKLSKQKPEWLPSWGTHMTMTDVGAGIDTTSWTLAAVIVGIGSNPKVYARLHAEIDAAIQEGRIEKGKPVAYDEAARLEYLQACIQEALRLWPNIAISLPRIVPKEGTVIDGHFIPGGYTVGMNSKQLGLDESIFGSDTHAFRPERWLEADKARRHDMETRNLSFGGPSRKCPGMHLAWLIMSKVLASFYLNFEARILNELNGKPGPGGSVWTEHGTFPTRWSGLEVELESV